MKGGKLDKWITVQVANVTQNELGEPVKEWVEFDSMWADEMPGTGSKETFVSDQAYAERQSIFKIRYIAGIKTGMRILYDELEWDILTSAQPFGRDSELHILAKAAAA